MQWWWHIVSNKKLWLSKIKLNKWCREHSSYLTSHFVNGFWRPKFQVSKMPFSFKDGETVGESLVWKCLNLCPNFHSFKSIYHSRISGDISFCNLSSHFSNIYSFEILLYFLYFIVKVREPQLYHVHVLWL